MTFQMSKEMEFYGQFQRYIEDDSPTVIQGAIEEHLGGCKFLDHHSWLVFVWKCWPTWDAYRNEPPQIILRPPKNVEARLIYERGVHERILNSITVNAYGKPRNDDFAVYRDGILDALCWAEQNPLTEERAPDYDYVASVRKGETNPMLRARLVLASLSHNVRMTKDWSVNFYKRIFGDDYDK